MLNIDTSVFVVIFLVGLLLVILDKMFCRPVGKIIDDRENKIARENAQIEQMKRDIEEKQIQIENILKETKKEAADLKENLIKQGEHIREEIISRTKESSKKIFQEKIAELDAEIAAAGKKLESEVGLYSDQIKQIFM